MKKEAINIPGNQQVTLAYIAKPPEAIHASLWWLQLKKMGIKSQLRSDAYANAEPKIAERFARELLADADVAPDLVIIPASSSRQFKPYLDALIAARPDLPVIDGAFTKPSGFAAGDTGRTYEQVLENTTLDETKLPADATKAARIWIIDDIFNTGNTVGAMATRLHDRLPAIEEIVVVCPLYVPFEKKSGRGS